MPKLKRTIRLRFRSKRANHGREPFHGKRKGKLGKYR